LYLLDEALVGEGLLGGQLDEGLDEGSEGGVLVELLLEHLEVALDLADLDEGWVAKLGEETEGLVNGTDSGVVLGN
jgi:hypothetical protein